MKSGSQIASLIRDINSQINVKLRIAFKDLELTPPQMMIMHMLCEDKKLKVSDISKKMSLANSTVSGILDRLENRNYISRKRSEKDKRIVYVYPSQQIEDLHTTLHNRVSTFLESIVEHASDEEMRNILTGLQTLKKLL
ncbi:DNA-binding MarR family transcriptional regulator [Salirhabdus euzebyi]|uniref:DNA-binding MarR family transcriptional regulator n=1 Tax=Salirhabdus euzebyi TaxID=394506 RepID=A0A841Q1Z7_9BACI|nr:MarR family transcriptional regulator [Salirhabdus euzebyi]MBB6452352.1 DNA-binding MarR family transcriptional regulator [Salirhabdus euzebyi]